MNQQTEALQRAYDIGAKGAEPTEAERLLFEAWMRGHCWMVEGDWDGETYVHQAEKLTRQVWPGAMRTRMLWAAWRDRAALVAPVQEPTVGVCGNPRNACGLPCEPCEGKPDPEWITTPAAQPAPVQEPAFKVGNLVTLTGGEYPGLGQWFVQLWDGDEVAARVYGNDREAINRRVAALNTPPAAQRQWVGLTDEEIDAVQAEYVKKLMRGVRVFAKDIEVKLKEKNT